MGFRDRFLTVALVLATAAPASALTYYVRQSGSDANDGLTPDTAFATIRPAGRLLRSPGDQVIVGPGTYREGNIEPLGSGTPDAPIVFFADASGAATGDPPGQVLILPPNTADATTGFIVFGRHDIAIDGFTIEGAADAGIQVRPHFSTDIDSTRVTARNNVVRNSLQRGIQMTAVGDVAAIGNRVQGSPAVGLSFAAGNTGEVRPLLTANTVEGSGTAISIRGAFGATVARNELRSNGKGLRIDGGGSLTISDNAIVGSRRYAMQISGATSVQSDDNVVDRGTFIDATGSIVFTGNQFLDDGVGLDLRSGTGAEIRVLDNRLPGTFVGGAATIQILRNTGRRLETSGAGDVTVSDNQLSRSLEVSAGGRIEVSGNTAGRFQGGAAEALIADNQFEGDLAISADRGTVQDNRAGSLAVGQWSFGGSAKEEVSADRFLVVERNSSSDVLRIGDSGAYVSRAIVRDNVADGELRAFASGSLEFRRNQVHGIACRLDGVNSEVVIAENTSRDSATEGIAIVGAGNAVVEGNISSGARETGLDVIDVRDLTVTDNTFSSNAMGGLVLRIPLAGDCNGDLRVTVDELIQSVDILVGERPLYKCPAVDSNSDGRAAIDELVLAVAAALDLVEPGRPGTRGGRVEIRSNDVEDNALFGIKLTAAGPVSARDNRVLRNGGIAIAVRSRALREDVEVAGNVLGSGGGEGLLVEGVSGALVRGNFVFGSREAGILLRDAPGASVVNNLVYANGNDGIAVGLGNTAAVADALLMNNTVYANGDWGVTIGTPGAPVSGVVVLDNIVVGNASGGVAAEFDSQPLLTVGFNLNDGGYSYGIVPSVTDFTADPRFVAPAGPDGILGHDSFADDDFHVKEPSAAIDAGSALAKEVGITGSAVAGLAEDLGILDIGFHYEPNAGPH